MPVRVFKSAALVSAILVCTTIASKAQLRHVPLEGAPDIARTTLFEDDWGHWIIASNRLTASLKQKFPLGTDESIVVRELTGQGFKYPPPPKPGCIPWNAPPQPVGKVYVPCPMHDVHRHLIYEWRREKPFALRFVCVQDVHVLWEASGSKVTSIRGSYDGICP